MSFTINSMVFKVFLPILVGLAIFATLDSIKVNSLDPNVNSLDDALDSIDRSVTFGDIYHRDSEENLDEDRSKQEVREAILINTIMAQRCDFVPLADDAEWRELNSGNPDKDVVYFNYDTGNTGEAFEVTKGEGEAPLTCVGADSPGEIVKPPLDIARPGPDSKQTNDMEGRFGRINFDIENTLVFDEPEIGSLSLYKDASTDFGNFPDFWRNTRTSFMLPHGLSTDDCSGANAAKRQAVFYPEYEPISDLHEAYSGNNEDINVYNEGLRLIYAFRVRMQNVPIVKEGYSKPTHDLTLCGPGANSDLKEFLIGDSDDPNSRPAKYVLCENATGYIQSNAGSIENTGETDVDSFDWASGFGTEIVFPRLMIRDGAADCLDQSPDLIADYDKVVGPKIDAGDGRESCSFHDVKSGHSQKLGDVDVKCGLQQETITQKGGGSFDYYNSAWYKERDSCYENLDLVGSYRIEKGTDQRISYGENGLTMEGHARTFTTNRVRYNLDSFEDISEIEIDFWNNGGRTDVNLNNDKMTFTSNDPHSESDYAEYITFEDHDNIGANEVERNWEEEEGATESGYTLTIKPGSNSAEWSWRGGTYEYPSNSGQPSIPDHINSIRFEQVGSDDSSAGLQSIEISGGSGC